MNDEDDGGAGSVLAVALVAAVVVLFALLASVAVLLDVNRRAAAAADSAALAGADAALGDATGLPCARAAEIAAGAGVRIDRCEQRGTLVRVRVSTSVLGVRLTAAALAGPPPAR